MKKLLGCLICALALTVSLYTMNSSEEPNDHFKKLKAAFEADDFQIQTYIEYPKNSGKFGIRAASTKAKNYETKNPKFALYLEGKPEDMGYQMGFLAEAETALMTTTYVETIPLSFINPKLPKPIKEEIGKIILKLMSPNVNKLANSPAIPQEYKDQLSGIQKGCQEANKNTRVTEDGLKLLNYGIDVLCSLIYEGSYLEKAEITPDSFSLPVFCNAISLKGTRKNKDYHYFGRDFQFDNGKVFQDTACMIIYKPDSTFNEIKALPSVVQAAPGMVGGITIMNINGVAMGVNMSPSHACDPDNPGLNSLLLVRHSVQYGKNAEETVARVKKATRGVSWLYPFADGSTGKAGVIEAIKSIPDKSQEEFAEYVHSIPFQLPLSNKISKLLLKDLNKKIPKIDFIVKYMQQADNLQTGIFVRGIDYIYPSVYLACDKGLWEWFNNPLWGFSLEFGKKNLHNDALTKTGFINRLKTNQPKKLEYEKNCPFTYYFAPPRQGQSREVLVTNFFISPELRYTAMHWWVARFLGMTGDLDDLQWRYDTLNSLIDQALKNGGGSIDKETAKKLIDFLNPQGQFPAYYINNPKSKDEKTMQILGSVSLCDLKAKTIESHYGYYSDNWVTITLPRYFE